jgi:hypothetical protein
MGSHCRNRGNTGPAAGVITVVSANINPAGETRSAHLVLVEKSGAKREIPQPSPVDGMAGAEQAMHEHGHQLREVKLVSEKRAIARWKAGELGWRRVA